MGEYHNVGNLKFKDKYIYISVDNKRHKVNLQEQSEKLLNADDRIRNNYVISASGYGIHWPDIDEDLSIDGLLGKKHIKKKKAVLEKK